MLLSVAVVVSLIVISACTKEGPPGKDGVDGEPGINGTDGTATCAVCHNNTETVDIFAAQWGNSLHAIGGHNFENRTTCAPCHTSQGFKEVVNTDATATMAAISNPANINCYTCHKIHDTYATADWELRKTTPIKFWLTGETIDLGTGNICAQCHQPRTSYVIPDVTDPTGTYTIASNQARFGPHYGAQSSTLTGTAYYKIGGNYSNSMHTQIENTCVTCHMGEAIGYYAGGHTFSIYSEEEEAYVTSGCVPCHTATEAVDLTIAFKAEIEELYNQLGVLLVDAGILNTTTGLAKPGTYTNNVAGAFWNYKSVYSDHSMGVHNPKFVKRILEQSILSLQ
jgi:nitrate/TMAO reductase-like tetraheme cytochrome c subunit